MTSAQLMPNRAQPATGRRRRLGGAFLIAATIVVLGGCSGSRLVRPTLLASPYEGPQIWAVAPFVNESGVSTVDVARMADLVSYEVEQIEGVNAVPVNRVIAAMQLLDLPSIDSPAHAVALMNVLGVDALVAGTVTAYDAFPPLRLGMAVQLFRNERDATRPPVDPRTLTRSTQGEAPPASVQRSVASTAGGLFEASNHRVRVWLREYARGRSVPDSAFEERIFDVSMELYTQFVGYRLLSDLLAHERGRLASVAQEEVTP